MPSGGARNRSGPPADPTSRTSERKGYTLTSLPREGYDGEVPDIKDFSPRPTLREQAIWAQLWSTPQACAWSTESWRWPIVADLARYMRKAEAKDAAGWLATAIRQLRDDLGLSHAGMRQHGWKLADIGPAAKPATKKAATNVTDIKSRLGRGA